MNRFYFQHLDELDHDRGMKNSFGFLHARLTLLSLQTMCSRAAAKSKNDVRENKSASETLLRNELHLVESTVFLRQTNLTLRPKSLLPGHYHGRDHRVRIVICDIGQGNFTFKIAPSCRALLRSAHLLLQPPTENAKTLQLQT